MNRNRVIFIIFFTASTYFALTPLAVPSPDISNWDKINHASAFAVLTFFACRGFKTDLWKIAALMALYGVAIECIQYFIPNRFFSVPDMIADIIGIFAGLYAIKRSSESSS